LLVKEERKGRSQMRIVCCLPPLTRDSLLDKELRQETGYRANRLEKLVDFYNHPGYISHNVHVFLAQDLE
jgi:hypothetical protein